MKINFENLLIAFRDASCKYNFFFVKTDTGMNNGKDEKKFKVPLIKYFFRQERKVFFLNNLGVFFFSGITDTADSNFVNFC